MGFDGGDRELIFEALAVEAIGTASRIPDVTQEKSNKASAALIRSRLC